MVRNILFGGAGLSDFMGDEINWEIFTDERLKSQVFRQFYIKQGLKSRHPQHPARVQISTDSQSLA